MSYMSSKQYRGSYQKFGLVKEHITRIFKGTRIEIYESFLSAVLGPLVLVAL